MPMLSDVSLPISPQKVDGKQRVASFSSFLNPAEENFIRNLADKEEDGEIGIFGAEKYFNAVMDDETPMPMAISARKLQFGKSASKLDLESKEKPKIRPGTPSVRSESSWNSQSALLQRIQKIPSKSKRSRGRNFLSRYKCSCCDKSSVNVLEESSDLKAPNHGEFPSEMTVRRSSKVDFFNMIESRSWFKEGIGETFTFPISKPEPRNFPSNLQIPVEKEEEKKPRKSIELFRNGSLSFQRNTTKIWKGNSQEEEELGFSDAYGVPYNDAASDCSSDLFEIDSMTGKSSHFSGRQSSNTTNSFTHTTCYPPSEVSIEWSVVTASAADFSATSDYDSDQKLEALKSMYPVQKRRPGILLGCRSEKAVGVAMDAHRKNEKGGSDESGFRRSESFLPLTRFEAEAKVSSLSSKQRTQAQVANLLEIQ